MQCVCWRVVACVRARAIRLRWLCAKSWSVWRRWHATANCAWHRSEGAASVLAVGRTWRKLKSWKCGTSKLTPHAPPRATRHAPRATRHAQPQAPHPCSCVCVCCVCRGGLRGRARRSNKCPWCKQAVSWARSQGCSMVVSGVCNLAGVGCAALVSATGVGSFAAPLIRKACQVLCWTGHCAPTPQPSLPLRACCCVLLRAAACCCVLSV